MNFESILVFVGKGVNVPETQLLIKVTRYCLKYQQLRSSLHQLKTI